MDSHHRHVAVFFVCYSQEISREIFGKWIFAIRFATWLYTKYLLRSLFG